MDHFEQLRRFAFIRGAEDYARAKEQQEPGQPLVKNNPHQNNHATDEWLSWEEGWEWAEQQEAK